MTASGKLYAFGYNNRGQCGVGIGGGKNILSPTLVKQVIQEANTGVSSQSPKFISVAAGSMHSLAVVSTGDVYAAGSNQQGQLGLPGIETSDAFAKVHSCEKVKV